MLRIDVTKGDQFMDKLNKREFLKMTSLLGAGAAAAAVPADAVERTFPPDSDWFGCFNCFIGFAEPLLSSRSEGRFVCCIGVPLQFVIQPPAPGTMPLWLLTSAAPQRVTRAGLPNHIE